MVADGGEEKGLEVVGREDDEVGGQVDGADVVGGDAMGGGVVVAEFDGVGGIGVDEDEGVEGAGGAGGGGGGGGEEEGECRGREAARDWS